MLLCVKVGETHFVVRMALIHRIHSEKSSMSSRQSSLEFSGQHEETNNQRQNDTEGGNGGFWKLHEHN